MLSVGSAKATTPPTPLSLLISPAVIDADATSAGALPPIVLTNRSGESFRVKVFPALAGQAVEGGLELRRGVRNDARARRAIRLTAPSVVRPHSTVEIRPFFRGFAGSSSLSIAAVITAIPLHPAPGSVKFRLNFLAGLFVHRPHVAAAHPLILSVRAKQVRTRFGLAAYVRNRGQKPAFITAVKFRVIDAHGKTLASGAGPAGFVVPRSARFFRTQLFHHIRSGRLRVEAIVRYGTHETRRSGFFVIKAS